MPPPTRWPSYSTPLVLSFPSKVELPLGLLGVAAGLVAYTGDDVDRPLPEILEARAEARAAKNWDLADAIRDQLKDLGLTIEDTAAGTRIKSL
ncbi:MAG: hypothetical protein ACLUQW_03005 [Collinsella sp.]